MPVTIGVQIQPQHCSMEAMREAVLEAEAITKAATAAAASVVATAINFLLICSLLGSCSLPVGPVYEDNTWAHEYARRRVSNFTE